MLKLNKSPYYDSGASMTMAVNDPATLAIADGVTLGAKTTTVASGATLEVAESGTVALGNALALKDGATLAFNFTKKGIAPVLDMADTVVAFGDQKALEDSQPKAVLSASAAESTFGVRAASYNIRCISKSDTGDMAWDSRKAALRDLVKSIAPDVIGFQEVRSVQYAYLREQLSGYDFIGEKRDGTESGEATPVAFRASRFKLVDSGTFWLSATPTVSGSTSWGDGIENSGLPRICTWTLLKDRTTGGAFCFASTHLDLNEGPRLAGMRLILSSLVEKYEAVGVPVVVVGDMNALETETSMVEAAAAMNDTLIGSKTDPTGPWRTFNGMTWDDSEYPCADALANYTAAERSANASTFGKRIDYMFSSIGTEVESFAIRNDTQPNKEQYPSDHFPVVAELVMPCENDLYVGKVRIEIDKDVPYVHSGRHVLTHGACLANDFNLEFTLPDWVLRAAVENGEIVIYTKPAPFRIRLR